MKLELFGMPLISYDLNDEGFYFNFFFLAFFWVQQERRLRLVIGAPYLYLAFDTEVGIGLCFFSEGLGVQFGTGLTIMLILSVMLISQLKWWTILLGLMLNWATIYGKQDIVFIESMEAEDDDTGISEA